MINTSCKSTDVNSARIQLSVDLAESIKSLLTRFETLQRVENVFQNSGLGLLPPASRDSCLLIRYRALNQLEEEALYLQRSILMLNYEGSKSTTLTSEISQLTALIEVAAQEILNQLEQREVFQNRRQMTRDVH